MNCVIYFSCTGNSGKVAEGIATKTQFNIIELTKTNYDNILNESYGTAVIVFPVHCQSYPAFIKRLFKNINAENVALAATYGKANAGNAVYEAAKLITARITAAAYIPAGHSYLSGYNAPADVPYSFIDKIFKPSPVTIPKRKKTPFAGFLPAMRSRLIVKIRRTDKCENCNLCGASCPYGAIERGKTNKKCQRCLKCVANCPFGALKFTRARILTRYLNKTKFDETILYLE